MFFETFHFIGNFWYFSETYGYKNNIILTNTVVTMDTRMTIFDRRKRDENGFLSMGIEERNFPVDLGMVMFSNKKLTLVAVAQLQN